MCIKLSVAMMLGLEPEVIKEDDRTIARRNTDGVIVREMKDDSSMPRYMSFPVQNRKDFEVLKHRYDPSTQRWITWPPRTSRMKTGSTIWM